MRACVCGSGGGDGGGGGGYVQSWQLITRNEKCLFINGNIDIL